MRRRLAWAGAGEPIACGKAKSTNFWWTRAREGKLVCRLKGGDPFVFGRGGEEAQALADAGIAFEVVPGVSAGHAVPAYAGIPITHRDITSTVTFIAGHEDPEKETSRLDWAHLGTCPGTLVFFMAVRNLPRITQALIDHGRATRHSRRRHPVGQSAATRK